MTTEQQIRKPRFSTAIIVIIIIASLVAGGLIGYSISNVTISGSVSDLQDQVSALQGQVSNLQSAQNVANPNGTYIVGENASLAPLYAQVKDSVVVIRGLTVQYDVFRRAYYSQVQGSGFVYNFTGQMVVITNYHVVQDMLNITVTFIDATATKPPFSVQTLTLTSPFSQRMPLKPSINLLKS